jgi:hypothetical protein
VEHDIQEKNRRHVFTAVLLRDSTEMLRRIDSQTVTDDTLREFFDPEDEGATIFETSVTTHMPG